VKGLPQSEPVTIVQPAALVLAAAYRDVIS
jgi:hypothetical protein